jgi:hypothetical protein
MKRIMCNMMHNVKCRNNNVRIDNAGKKLLEKRKQKCGKTTTQLGNYQTNFILELIR